MRLPYYIYLLLLIAKLAHSSLELNIATGEHPPFTSQYREDNGLVNAVVQAAFKASGVAVTFRYLPWQRALSSTEAGVYPATSYWAMKTARSEHFYHSEPILYGGSVLISLATTGELNNFDSLNNKTVGAVRGYTYNLDFWQRSDKNNYQIHQVNSDEQNFKKLFAGRIDALIIDRVVGQTLMNNLFTARQKASLAVSEADVVTTSVHLLISRQSPNAEQWLKLFNQGLATIISNGTYQKIANRYPMINTGIAKPF